jgi:hypothetical protein
MAEIDLIPSDYRNRVVIFDWLRRLIVALVVFMLLGVVIYVVLEVANKRLGEDVESLQNRQKSIAMDRDALREISEKRDHFQRQWEMLKNLRDSKAAEKMFVIVDRAISAGDVWFLSWEFQRSDTFVEFLPDSPGEDYFVVLSGNKDDGTGEALQINTHMTIKGQASDHSALSKFVRRLYEQPEVKDVRILNTSLMNAAKVVNFDMIVTVNSELVIG